MSDRIAWFKDISKDSIAIAGGKGANLGEMFNAGLPVPAGFVVTAQTYAEFIERTNIKSKISDLLKEITDYQDTELLQTKANAIQKLIIDTDMPEDIASEIIDAYDVMDVESTGGDTDKIINHEHPFVAVRSSATAEDLPEASFAGQQATFLNIKGEQAVVQAVRACWASLFTARATYYRMDNDFDHMKVLISVVVQKMVNSDAAGVMFSANPATNDRSEILLEAAWGLGEAVVSGSVNPDIYIVDKNSMTLKKKELKKKDWGLFRNKETGETEKKDIDPDIREAQVLKEEQILGFAELAKKIEEHYGKPQDMEFAVEKDKLYITQSRAITTLKDEPKQEAPQEEDNHADAKVIVKGETASPGIASGPVKLIHEVSELDQVKEGDVIVTTMTTPDMVPAMQRSAAIVTDEGGMTCIEGDALLYTDRGFIKMKEVQGYLESDIPLKVLSLDSKTKKIIWRDVLKAMKRRSGAVEFSPYLHPTGDYDNRIRITGNHKMITLEGSSIKTEALIDMISNNSKLMVADRIPRSNTGISLEGFDKEKLLYLCGAFFSDGHIVHRPSGAPMRVMFSQKVIPEKVDFINKVSDDFNEVFDAKLTNYTNYNSIDDGDVYTRAGSFENSQSAPAKTLSWIRENVLEVISSVEEEFLYSYLGGYIDGDGHFNKAKKHIEIYVHENERFLQSILVASLRLGIFPSIRQKENGMRTIVIKDKVNELLKHCIRVKGYQDRVEDSKLFASRQVIESLGIKDWRGSLFNYLKNDSLIGMDWLRNYVRGRVDEETFSELTSLQNADFRMMRLKPLRDTETIDVYNITVDADTDEDHNYVVFTDKYTPLIVGNCHAAIVSREMGTPCIVGTENGSQLLNDGQMITVDATGGVVYGGKIETHAGPQVQQAVCQEPDTITATSIKVIMDLPDFANHAAKTNADGVGLVRMEIMIANGGVHPAQFIRENRDDDYTQLLVDGIGKIASAFKGKPVWVRTSDIRTDEYLNLKGGDQEPHETDPMIGWHAIRRALDEPRILKAEFKAMKILHDNGINNVGIMLPFVIRANEVRQAKEIMREVGLEPCQDIDFGVMCETPASVWAMDGICKEGITFVSFGTNDLTQLTLGIDRNNQRIAHLFDEMHPAVLGEIEMVVNTCKKYGVKTSICGQAGSRPEMAEFLVKIGIDSISANPDAVHQIKEVVARTEKKLILDAERRAMNGD